MAVLRAPSVDGLDSSVIPLYREREMAGAVTNLYLLQQSMWIVSEIGQLYQNPYSLSGKTRNFLPSYSNLNVVTGEARKPRPAMLYSKTHN